MPSANAMQIPSIPCKCKCKRYSRNPCSFLKFVANTNASANAMQCNIVQYPKHEQIEQLHPDAMPSSKVRKPSDGNKFALRGARFFVLLETPSAPFTGAFVVSNSTDIHARAVASRHVVHKIVMSCPGEAGIFRSRGRLAEGSSPRLNLPSIFHQLSLGLSQRHYP
jgi:hypothetical protein